MIPEKHKKEVANTALLLPGLDRKLIKLLQSLKPTEWDSPTIAPLWRVKDIAAHLLDGNVRTLSFSRDAYFGQKMPPVHSYEELVGYLNKLNHSWTDAMLRMSPRLLTALLESTGKDFYKHIKKLDPAAPAVFPVAWAGQDSSPNWFHIAREYTEKFIHQQQIRHALDKPDLLTKKYYRPFLATLFVGLPYTYRNTAADMGSIVEVRVSGKAGGSWKIIRQPEGWELITKPLKKPNAIVSIQPDDAWKLFSKSLRPQELLGRVRFEGDVSLGKVALELVAVMA